MTDLTPVDRAAELDKLTTALRGEADDLEQRGGMISAHWIAAHLRFLADNGRRWPQQGEGPHITNSPPTKQPPAADLPSTNDEILAWLARHGLSTTPGVGVVLSSVRRDILGICSACGPHIAERGEPDAS